MANCLKWAGRPLTVSEIARRMYRTRQIAQPMVNALEGNGLVEYLPNLDHVRAKLVKSTPEGMTVLKRLDQRRMRWAERMSSEMDPKKIEAAVKVLLEARENVERSRRNQVIARERWP